MRANRRRPLGVVAAAAFLVFALAATAPATGLSFAERDPVLFLRPGGPAGPGALMALNSDGSVVVVDQPLADPRGLVVLSDGTALVTDGQLGLLLGIGGRFGERQKVKLIEGLPEPHDLVVTRDGAVLATTIGDGGLWRLDIAARTGAPVATGLGRPVAVALAADGASVLVADARGGRVVSVGPTGNVQPVATGFRDLVGVAPAPGGGAYACDRGQDGVFRIAADGAVARLADVSEPEGLETLSPDPATGVAYLAVPAAGGFTAVHPDTGATAVIAGLDALGPSFAPPSSGQLFDPPAALRSAAAPTTSADAPGSDGEDPSAAAADGDGRDDSTSSSSPVVPLALGALGVLALGAGAALVRQRRQATVSEQTANERLEALRRAQAAWERLLELEAELARLKEEKAKLEKGDFDEQQASADRQTEIDREIKRLEEEIKKARDEMLAARGKVGSVPAKELKDAEAAAAKAKADAENAPPPSPSTTDDPKAAPKEKPGGTPPVAGVPPCTHGAEMRVTTAQETFTVPTSQPKVSLSAWVQRGRLSPEAFSGLLEAAGLAAEALEAVDEVLGWASYAGVPAPAAIGQAAAGLRAMAAGLGAVTKAGKGILSKLPSLYDLTIVIDKEDIVCTCQHLTVCEHGTWVDKGTTLTRTRKKAPSWSISGNGLSLADVAARLEGAANQMDGAVANINLAGEFACP